MGKKCQIIREKWNTEYIQNAIKNVKSGLSIAAASRPYKIPRRTLRNWLKREDTTPKRKLTLGFGLTRNHICSFAFQICDEKGIPHPFSNNKTGKDWFYVFMRRNNDIVLWQAHEAKLIFTISPTLFTMSMRADYTTHGDKGETETVVACTNATGTNWIPLMISYKGKYSKK
ncbi:hypothetical protein PR048_018498 [Dryococelus australis]|uniref:HTH psq-type domain-containing protein n=1 Tax=Dryococelus australis TaxID=614101 RepID=A0ABQ9HCP6_9NEOP|nr:hypothetical protein PR048_018498 [Dryococelus australis]